MITVFLICLHWEKKPSWSGRKKIKKKKRIFIERLNFLAAGGVRMCK